MLLTPLMMLPLAAAPQSALPQPTLPTPDPLSPHHDGSRWMAEDQPLWLVLSPPWLGNPVGTPAMRAEFAASAAARSGMDAARLSDFLDARALEQVDLQYRLSAGGSVLLEGRERVQPGVPARFADGWTRAVTLDMDVEIASSSAIADPRSGLQWGGRSLALRLLPVPGRGWVAECALTDAEPAPPQVLATGNADIHGLEALASAVGEAGFCTLLKPGEEVRMLLPGAGGRQLELQLRADAPLPAGTLPFGRGSWLEAGAAAADEAVWQRVVDRWLDDEAVLGGPQGFLLVEGEGHEERAAALLAGLQRATRPLGLRVEWSVERGGETVDGGVVALPAVAGRELVFASGEVTRHITDWDVEVALDSRLADPVLRNHLAGARGRVRPLPVRGGLLLDVDLEFSRVIPGEPRQLQLAGRREPAEGPEGRTTGGAPAQHVLVYPVDRRAAGFTGRYAVDGDGRVVLERAVPAAWGEGAVLRVVLEASSG